MSEHINRRNFIHTAGTLAAAGLASTAVFADENKKLIIGVACSPRKGKTTATAVGVALDAAKGVDAGIETELIDLGGMSITGWTPDGNPDDFQFILPSLRAQNLTGIIIGTPVYFRNMSSLCAAFLERLSVLREPIIQLANKVVGVLSVGAYRNGGQELAITQIQAAMLCHEAVIVGGKTGAFQGATLWNAYQDDIMKDEFGIETARKLGMKVAESILV